VDRGRRSVEIAEIARTADRLGFHHLTCSEHVAIPTAAAPIRGARYYDPLATFGFLAAQTTAIRFVTHVLVLGYHHPLAIAKRYGTLDRISDGRLVLGVGVGTLEDEFRLLGARFEGRGAIYQDAPARYARVRAARAPRHEGSHHRFGDVVVDLRRQPDIPIWLGGRTARSLRRALIFGDSWDVRSFSRALGCSRAARAIGRRGGADQAVRPRHSHGPQLDVTDRGGRDAFIADARRYRTLGATCLNVRVRHESLAHYLDQLGILAREIAPVVA
jgi:probable F420-dependent oxidoreductase